MNESISQTSRLGRFGDGQEHQGKSLKWKGDSGRYIKGKRLHDTQDISCIKLDSVMQSVLGTDSFNMSQLGYMLDRALEPAPLKPLHITHRLSLSAAELRPTVVDVGIRIASERAVPIHDYSETFGQIDAKLKDIMQEVGLVFRVAGGRSCLLCGLR